ncbi:DUF4303 domain-containing protein [Kangiella sp.]|uniref:DUF4303 domain-containing protein n=1 Tax=Kangiella sp. TaxID=1920245 RepID=UPI003A945BB7
MTKSDYQKIKTLISSQIREFVLGFAASKENRGVYALALDVNEDYGDAIVCVNTEESLSKRVSSVYTGYSEDEIGGMSGIRFNPGEFEFSRVLDLGNFQKAYEKKIESLKTEASVLRSQEKLSETVAEALLESRGTFNILDTTEDFIFYHCFHDSSHEQSQRLILKTVDRASFDKCFPEIAEYEKLQNEISNKKQSEQVKFWLSLMRAHALNRPTKYSRIYFQSHGPWDIEEELASIGPMVVSPVIDLLKELTPMPPFNEKGTAEFAEDGAISRACSVSCDLLLTLRKLGHVPEFAVRSLTEILSSLVRNARAAPPNEPVSLVIPNIARALHVLRPDRFPPEQLAKGNRIENIDDYLART